MIGVVHTKWDVDFSFSVGSAETHEVDVHWTQWWGEITVAVDGEPALRERHPLGMRSLRRYTLTVGHAERHDVVIEKRKARLAGGVRAQAFRAVVDGDLVAEH